MTSVFRDDDLAASVFLVSVEPNFSVCVDLFVPLCLLVELPVHVSLLDPAGSVGVVYNRPRNKSLLAYTLISEDADVGNSRKSVNANLSFALTLDPRLDFYSPFVFHKRVHKSLMSKKGSTKTQQEQSVYEPREVVLAKVRGFPPWPGMV